MGEISREMRENWYISVQKKEKNYTFSYFPFPPFWRARRLMSAQQLAAEIKALFRVGEVQMESGFFQWCCNAAMPLKVWGGLNAAWVSLKS